MTEFIELYKSYPCLWKTKSREYKDRNKKDAAYTVLLQKLKEIEPNATKKTVTAKINSIRGSFRRELKKIQESKHSGAGADETYVTQLWYYDQLLFTRDQEIPRASVSNLIQNGKFTGDSGSEQEHDDDDEVSKIQFQFLSFISELNIYLQTHLKLRHHFLLPCNSTFIIKIMHVQFSNLFCVVVNL